MRTIHSNTLQIFFLLFISSTISAQVYKEKQSRHRFAQLTVGLDLESSFGGQGKYIGAQGGIFNVNLNNTQRPRILIGGTHFWGHADFYVAIPITNPDVAWESQLVTALRGVETVFKYYPWRIENKKLIPYLGASFAQFKYKQVNNHFRSVGGELNQIAVPIHAGFTYNSENYLIELGCAYKFNTTHDYFISKSYVESISTPPFFASFSFRYMLETTLSAEQSWESGRTQEVTNMLAERGKLNGFYLGVGLSSAFWLKQNAYNASFRPYIGKYDVSIMPDFTLGYYLHDLDINLALGYRGFGANVNAYDTEQNLFRKSVLFEVSKYLFDYHGFVPFVGPNISYENLSFNETDDELPTQDINESKLAYSLTFGWDIRPNRIQSWILRTNLRWSPNLTLDLNQNVSISFDNLEFNFIQLVIFPNRMIKKKSKN